MLNSISKEKFVAFIHEASKLMLQNMDYLTKLDAKLGDGDLGLTMNRGFSKAYETARNCTEDDIGKLLMKIGLAIAKEAPSTAGTLIASGFMKAAKSLGGKTKLLADDLSVFAKEFSEGMQDRGKATPGDRTIIDAVYPAALAVKKTTENCQSISDAAHAGYLAAKEGVENTKNMKAVFGRGVFFGDQVLGHPDQGAVVGMLLYQALATVLK